jgi:lysophospholipase L1-like esterase
MVSILCFGDSITQGFVDLEGGWTQRLRRRLDQEATLMGPHEPSVGGYGGASSR